MKLLEIVRQYCVHVPSTEKQLLVSLEFHTDFETVSKMLNDFPNLTDDERKFLIKKHTMVYTQYAYDMDTKPYQLTQSDKESMESVMLDDLDLLFQAYCNQRV